MTEEKSTLALVREAIDEGRQLARLELALAKQEIRSETLAGRRAGVGLGVGAALALSGFTMMLVTIALAFSASWLPALLVGVIALCVGGIVAVAGYKVAPKKPLEETRRRAQADLHMLRRPAEIISPTGQPIHPDRLRFSSVTCREQTPSSRLAGSGASTAENGDTISAGRLKDHSP